MSNGREIWWSYAKAVIRQYPWLHQEYAELHQQSMAADYSGMPKAGGASRTTEMIATRTLPSRTKQREHDAVWQAIRTTEHCRNSRDRLRLIDMYHWKQSHNLEGAALQIPCSPRTARQWNGDFIRLVAENLGLAD